jgi:CRISPR-associated RAMP protein (TIGR02581 family)
MAEPIGHDALVNRYSVTGTLVCTTALHVGTGGSPPTGLEASDLPLARDGRGLPYVPGSSFRGAFRSGLESLLRGLERPDGPEPPDGPEGSEEPEPSAPSEPTDRTVCNPFETGETAPDRSCAERTKERRRKLEEAAPGPAELTEAKAFELAWEESCPICRLFGQLFLASRLRVADLALLAPGPDGEPVRTSVRKGVGIDRDLRTAARNILYDFEVIPAGARFSLRMEIENAEDHEVGLVLTGLDLLGEGMFTVGGKAARGLGLVRVEETAVRRRTAADFFAGTGREALPEEELEALRTAARVHYAHCAEGGR